MKFLCNVEVKSSLRTFTLVALLGLSACATTDVTRLSHNEYPPKPSDCKIAVFTEAPKEYEFEELAVLDARSSQSLFEGKDLEAMMPDMVAKTCELGGDAIILKSSQAGGVNWVGPADRGHATAVAIKLLRNKKK